MLKVARGNEGAALVSRPRGWAAPWCGFPISAVGWGWQMYLLMQSPTETLTSVEAFVGWEGDLLPGRTALRAVRGVGGSPGPM